MIENTVKIFRKRSHGVCGLRGIGRFNIGIGISTDVCRVSFFLDEEVGGGPWKFLCGNPKYRFLGRLCSVGKGRESWYGTLLWTLLDATALSDRRIFIDDSGAKSHTV